MAETIISTIAVIGILIFFLWLFILLPAKMAKKRGRSAVGWVLLFLIVSPFWGIIILLVLGDSKQKIREDIMKEIRQNSEES